MVLIQPSLAAAENIFLYLLTQSMKEKQFFGNYLETSIMLQYNSTTTDKLEDFPPLFYMAFQTEPYKIDNLYVRIIGHI